MSTSVENKDPEWFGVQDPKKRKQIQDRLAQRSRRKRLAEKRGSTPSKGSPVPQTTPPPPPDATSEPPCLPTSTSVPEQSSLASVCHAFTDDLSNGLPFIEPPASVSSALYLNGLMLGFTYATSVPMKSSPAPQAPESLQPTELQLTVAHIPWVDRFPFPNFRDNFIRLEAQIKEEEFLTDLFCRESFHIKPGQATWDPDAWLMSTAFARKWGFLLAEPLPWPTCTDP